jgi:hypothetical protein
LISKPPGISVPGSATGTRSPAVKFLAPQTIWRSEPSPCVDLADAEAVGLRVLLEGLDLADHHEGQRGEAEGRDRLHLEAEHREDFRDALGGDAGEVEVTGERLEGDFHGSGELAQEARVVVVEVADVVDAVDQHRDAFEAEAEGEARPSFGSRPQSSRTFGSTRPHAH